jgi:ubiquinone biosynthesis monooxygenase Coq7
MKSSVTSEQTTAASPGLSDPELQKITIPYYMLSALRSDHAGEAGAVEIYRGILTVTRDDTVRAFAQEHLQTERRHLALIESIVPLGERSRLLALCRWAGWITGALPALFGAPAVYRTIEAVESFVDAHYRQQVEVLEHKPDQSELRGLLESCRADEIAHRDDARSRLDKPRWIGRLWSWLIARGSEAGVRLVMRF